MVEFEFIEEVDGIYKYYYYPEYDRSAPGIIGIDDNGERYLFEISKRDIKNLYAGHAFSGIADKRKTGRIVWW